MNQNNSQNGSGQKKSKSDFVIACNGVKLALKGRLARAHIVSTFDYQNKGFPKHSTYLIVDPNDPKVQQLAQACRAIKQQFFPNMPDVLWNSPIKDGRTPNRPDGEQWQDWQKGNVFISVSTGVQYPPAMLVKDSQSPKGYRDANVLDEKNFFYDGAEAVVEFAAGGMEGNNKGINLYFNGILGLGVGERIVIASSGSFNADEAFADFLKGTANGADQNYNQGNGQNQNTGGQMNGNHQNHSNGYQGQGNQGYQGNGQQNGAQQGMNGNGQQNHGNQTQGYNQGGHGQNAQNGASHSNQNNGYNNNQNYNQNNNGGGSLV
jgi:hypothetical protein